MNWLQRFDIWLENFLMNFIPDPETDPRTLPMNLPPEPIQPPIEIKPQPTPREIVLNAAKAALGKDMDNSVSNEVACVASVVSVLSKTPYAFHMKLTYTPFLFNVLKASPQWRVTLTPSAGCLIVSPTKDAAHEGHCGIFVSDTRIASNNSYGVNAGKWTDNYSFPNWVSSFRGLGLHVYIFEPI